MQARVAPVVNHAQDGKGVYRSPHIRTPDRVQYSQLIKRKRDRTSPLSPVSFLESRHKPAPDAVTNRLLLSFSVGRQGPTVDECVMAMALLVIRLYIEHPPSAD
jgi:hypothetical protein